MTMKLIETRTLATSSALIEFSSIPQTYTDLLILTSFRDDNAGQTVRNVFISLNGSSSNLTARLLQGNGSGAFSFTNVRITYSSAANSTSNTFSSGSIHIPNYSGTTNKSLSSDSVSENNGAVAFQAIDSVLWSNTAPIISLGLTVESGSFVAGSTVSLYGITKGSDGIVTVS